MPLVELNGIRIGVDVAGPPDAPTAVLVMGTGSRGRVWRLHQVPALIAAGYRVVTFDNRGVPPSDECAGGFRIEDMVADTVAVVEHVGGGPVTLVGTSLGARIVTELALARPDLVSRAVALAGHARMDPACLAISAGERELHDAGVTLPPAYHAGVSAHLNLSPATLRDEVAARDWMELFEMAGARVGPGVRAQLALSTDVDRRDAYATIRVPMLVVGFADDRRIPPYLCAELAGIVPGARYTEVPDCGHLGYLERPDAVNALILEFLAAAGTQTDALRASHSRA